ncbi:flavin reductase family protein [Roseovarius sp. E0-M6]|uniref:flavin reductase family protein n=1 Tax=Roseovarius sp. E0-M6 TaxID=3127118 RepID=UPI00300FE2A8
MTHAPPPETSSRFDFSELEARDRYKLLIGSVVPRPIAWVTTLSTSGVPNAAPYSFFNCLSADPAIVAIGVEYRSDKTFKDTAQNIRDTEQFTVNICDHSTLEQMNITAIAFPPETDELTEADLTLVPGEFTDVPRIAEAPVSFECRRYITLNIGLSRDIVLGQVLGMWARPGLVNERLHVDATQLDALGRMGGHAYCRSNATFDLPTPSPEQWAQMQTKIREDAQ